jgi:hypothetical protein
MGRPRLDPGILAARESVERLDAGRVALRAMTREERLIIYVELEREFKSPSNGTTPTRVAKTKRAKANKSSAPNKHTTKYPSYAYLAEKFVRENPQGVRTMEVAHAIGQPIPSAYRTLLLLQEQKRIQRHGNRNHTLWTVLGVTPIPRVQTIDAAIMKVLSNADGDAVDALMLVTEVTKIMNEALKRKPRADSITTAIYALIAKGLIAKSDANEHGPMYVLANGKGRDAAPTMN